MGIPVDISMEEVILAHRRRRHRVVTLNCVEDEIEKMQNTIMQEEYIAQV